MTNHWAFYLYKVNSSLASIYVNLGLRSEVPIISKPWLLWVWVYFKSPRPDGLSDSAEAPTLFAIEDALDLRISQNCHALHCGRITTEGRREFYFYAETRDGFYDAVSTALSVFEGYRFSSGEQEDALWKQYLDVLYPPPEQMECIKNRDLLDVLTEKGDVLTAAREVTHWIYFPSEQSRASFNQVAAIAGFNIVSESLADGSHPFGTSVSRTQPVEQKVIDATVIELLKLTRQFDGDYDGWETPIINH